MGNGTGCGFILISIHGRAEFEKKKNRNNFIYFVEVT